MARLRCGPPTEQTCKHLTLSTERDAFGSDDFNPLSHKGDNLSKGNGVGYMIVDSLDTMMLMRSPGDEELDGMYDRAFAWIEKDLDFSQVGAVSTFEVSLQLLTILNLTPNECSFIDYYPSSRRSSFCLSPDGL